MTRIEQISFKDKKDFVTALDAVMANKDIYRNYTTKTGEDKTVKIISNGRLYIGNNFSISINEAQDKTIYLSIDYFGTDDRIRLSRLDKVQSTDVL